MAKRNSFSEKQGATITPKSKVICSDVSRDTFQQIKSIETAPASRGNTFLLKYLRGSVLTRDQAIKAKCCDCMGFFYDGKLDCDIPDCPLYPYMPYRQKSTTTGRKASARSGKTRGE